MGIQFKQGDGLNTTFSSLSGYLQGQIGSGSATGIASGNFFFSGDKVFYENVTCSGAQGLEVKTDSFYDQGHAFIVSGLSVGKAIASPRSSTAAPEGALQVTGGTSYFEGDLRVRNEGRIIGSSISGTAFSGQSGFLNYVQVTGVTGFLKLHRIPDYTETGNIPSPATGTVFRSGNNLMIV